MPWNSLLLSSLEVRVVREPSGAVTRIGGMRADPPSEELRCKKRLASQMVLELTEWCALRCANANPQEASSPSRRSCSVPIPCWTTVWIHGHHPAEALLQELQVRDLTWCIVNRG